jgi:hypothetical protein
MSQDEQAPSRSSQEEAAVDAGLDALLGGVSPANMVHGAIDLGDAARDAQRPSQAAIEAARLDILAALWGSNW